MHARTVPVQIAEGFWMPVDGITILLTRALKEVACNPNLVAGFFCTLGENLEFPLAGGDFCVDAFDIQTCFKTQVEVLFNTVTTVGVSRTNGTVVWALRSRVAVRGETRR